MMDRGNDGRHDFDFLHGNWTIHNRRLVRRLAGCTEWEEFGATHECYPVLGGLGNVDHFHAIFTDGKPLEGMSIRLFDPTTRLWSIFWADNRRVRMDPPVDDVFEGTPIRFGFHWSDITPTSARWEQAFSADGGATWETNWVMEMTKRPG
jgi:hypothetical protein